MRKILWVLVVSSFVILSNEAWACRFWAVMGDNVPQELIDQHLIGSSSSLKSLGRWNLDGWGLGYYQGNEFFVYRGKKSADIDGSFDEAVLSLAETPKRIVVAHLRNASSGCRGVPNPHPFIIERNGKKWTFGHNGHIQKDILISLITDEYLKDHPPIACSDDPPSSWVDTELYFIYLLKMIEENDHDVVKGLRHGLLMLQEKIGERTMGLNFFLSDGDTLWAFRKNNPLVYHYEEKTKMSIISSVAVALDREWMNFPENVLGVFRIDQEPEFIAIEKD